jgi:mRNA interferase RelE/StbE
MTRRYGVNITRTAEKEFKSLQPRIREQIRLRILDLGENPRPHDCKRSKGTGRDHRVASGEYRILYEIDDLEQRVEIWRIGHRKDVYRNL